VTLDAEALREIVDSPPSGACARRRFGSGIIAASCQLGRGREDRERAGGGQMRGRRVLTPPASAPAGGGSDSEPRPAESPRMRSVDVSPVGIGGETGGARVGEPRHSRMARVASGGWIAASSRIGPWHAGQWSTSTANTRRISSAQE
jgi:hypothetical protein